MLTSRIETYGLVVVEALARGIPAVVSTGTGGRGTSGRGTTDSAETPGTAVPAGDPESLGGAARVAHRTDAAALLAAGGARSARYAARMAADGSGGVGHPESPAEVTVDPAGLPPAPPPTPGPRRHGRHLLPELINYLIDPRGIEGVLEIIDLGAGTGPISGGWRPACRFSSAGSILIMTQPSADHCRSLTTR